METSGSEPEGGAFLSADFTLIPNKRLSHSNRFIALARSTPFLIHAASRGSIGLTRKLPCLTAEQLLAFFHSCFAPLILGLQSEETIKELTRSVLIRRIRLTLAKLG